MPAETHSSAEPLDADGVLTLIRSHLAEILDIEEDRVVPGARFVEDLEADSLALIELVEAIEEELGERSVGFRIDDEDLAELRTVGEAVAYVLSRLGG